MEALHPVSYPSPLVPNILVVCPEQMAAHYKTPLAGDYRVAVTSSPDVAVQFLARTTHLPVLVVDGDANDGGAGVCETARSVRSSPLVLLTLSKPDVAGRVIDKCDSILLKPFAPNLLAARVGRMLRLRQKSDELCERSAGLLARVEHERAKVTHIQERRVAGLLVEWPNQHCPYCQHSGVVLFDYAGHRRAWYACGECRKVWLARRLE